MKNAPFSVGLTGGIGSGKTTVANLFAELGITVIDSDAVARQLTAPGGAAIDPIREAFGSDAIDTNGGMNRAKVREQVFGNPAAKARLEAILHPLIRQECERLASEANSPYIIFDVPLLIGSPHWLKRVQRILVVDCPEELQISRVITRSGLTEKQIRAIMATQSTRDERLAAADDVIENSGSPEKLPASVAQLHALYLDLSRNQQ